MPQSCIDPIWTWAGTFANLRSISESICQCQDKGHHAVLGQARPFLHRLGIHWTLLTIVNVSAVCIKQGASLMGNRWTQTSLPNVPSIHPSFLISLFWGTDCNMIRWIALIAIGLRDSYWLVGLAIISSGIWAALLGQLGGSLGPALKVFLLLCQVDFFKAFSLIKKDIGSKGTPKLTTKRMLKEKDIPIVLYCCLVCPLAASYHH